MAPLPCSPVSNSTASESQSFPPSEESSDDSLTTPRPGPSDPSQRTIANLSRPSVPAYSSSPEAARAFDRAFNSTKKDISTDGRPRNPYTYGSSPSRAGEATAAAADVKAQQQQIERQQSSAFAPRLSSPSPRRISYANQSPNQPSPSHAYSNNNSNHTISPNSDIRQRTTSSTAARVLDDFAESSADENTAITRRNITRANYGTAATLPPAALHSNDMRDSSDQRLLEYDGATEDDSEREEEGGIRRTTSSSRSRTAAVNSATTTQDGSSGAQPAATTAATTKPSSARARRESLLKAIAEKYGSVELENKGSVARDHLALERTFLAWLRTSLSFASIGIAVTQLFRLNTTITTPDGSQIHILAPTGESLREVGKPLGATFIGISILILLLGFHRYFESQHYVIRGKFPASRGTILIVTFVAAALIITSLVVVVAIAPTAFEK